MASTAPHRTEKIFDNHNKSLREIIEGASIKGHPLFTTKSNFELTSFRPLQHIPRKSQT